jgi:hypothetical protein
MHLRIPSSTDLLTPASAKLAAALAAANGKASAHTASLRDLADAATNAEAQLAALGLPVTRRRGARADYLSGGSVATAYKYPRTITHATLQRGTSGEWYLTACVTTSAWPTVAGSVTVSIPADADEYLVAKLHDRYSVIRPVTTPLILDDLIPLPMDVQAAIMRSFSSV